jgi:thiamine-monophosphate kinase
MLTPATEIAFIERLASALPRSPHQINKLQEADAEIIILPGGSMGRLALSIDTIEEEIRAGLYTDPWLIGWMSVMVNMSDLAAVGADPVGILLSETIPPGCSQEFLTNLQRGITDACRACGTFVLGGDTNAAANLSITGCAAGMIPGGNLLTRRGSHVGDSLYCSGALGTGNAYAFTKLTGTNNGAIRYQPRARLLEGRLVREYASACMDTSDGVTATLDQLMRINGIGFHLEKGWENSLDGTSRELIHQTHTPEWLLLAGLHGEFELLFTIPAHLQNEFISAASLIGWTPRRIGHVTESQELAIADDAGEWVVDTGRLRNLGQIAATDFSSYLHALLDFDSSKR